MAAPSGPRALPARRWLLAALAVLVLTGGVAARAALPDAVGGPLGDALYATLVVLVVALVRPRTTAWVAAVAGWMVSAAVEAFQLTGVPADVVARFSPARYVLGTTFVAGDLAWYAAGAALGGLLVGLARADLGDLQVRHTRSPHARWHRRAVPAVVGGVLAVALATGGAAAWVVHDEAGTLRTSLSAARTALAGSEGRVADDATRTALAASLADAAALLDETPLLERRPGDAVRARRQVADDAAAVAASRLAKALADADAARTALAPLTARGDQVVAATEGLGAPDDARAALQGALATAGAAVTESTSLATATPGQAARVEAATAALTASATTVREATVALMTAQDAVTCPYPDQVWFPEAGHLADADLAAIPWAPTYRVRADVLPSLVELDAAFRARFGQNLRLNSAYRSFEQQTTVFNPDDPNPLAAPPGCSNHGLGTAIDIDGISTPGNAQLAWLDANAGRFGWENPDWARPTGRLPEPWHWQHVSTPTTY
ncbi:DUF2809 domain-containing protein [Xylanimonas protaetiae]|nr:DUF2809 domain-containing protein [Xylanimonas protaetiae]